MDKNIFGEPLITCSNEPLTGFFRNGCCDTDDTDLGMHTVKTMKQGRISAKTMLFAANSQFLWPVSVIIQASKRGHL